MKHLRIAGLVLCLSAIELLGVSPSRAQAQNVTLWFDGSHDYFEPLLADPRAAQTVFNFPQISDQFEFSQKPGRRYVWDIAAGREIPIFTRGPADLGTHATGFGLWVGLSFHVIEDMWKDESNPIVNTDYRFSLATLKVQHALAFNSLTQTRHSIIGKADLFHHESTHLGDEFSLRARLLYPTFERINVSYEFRDLAAGYQLDFRSTGRLQARVGAVSLWRPRIGYYSDHTFEPQLRPLFPSKRNTEWYGQFDYLDPHTTGFPGGRWSLFASADLRDKTVLNYHKQSASQMEDHQLSTAALVGFRTPLGARPLSLRAIYFRYYYGVNPAGQLRNQRDYQEFGLGLAFSIPF